MSRVMLVCPEPLGHGQPAGVGIRFLEIARVLRGDGHEVTTLAPDGAGQAPDRAGLTAESLLETSRRSDVAVVQGHVANAFFQHAEPIPTVIDLYDPFIIENLHYFANRGAEVFQHDHFTLMNSLARGDFFLCASEAQRMFYLGALLACGRLNPELFEQDPELKSLLAIAPFGVPPAAGTLRLRSVQAPPGQPAGRRRSVTDILFGGIYDWYDPITAIEAVALVPDATLTFTHHPNPDLTPQGKLAEAMEHARKKNYDFVRFEPWAPYERRAEFFERFSMALITFPRSLETDLSMRTRIYDYLWCGLPIVTSSAPGTDEILARYDCGIVVDEDSPRTFADAIQRVDRERMTRGARQFVDDHQWDRTLVPLRAFVREPRIERTKETFAMRPGTSYERSPERLPASILDRLKRRLKA
jgi:glycosyltransferase involved in cell wall biosynthesis